MAFLDLFRSLGQELKEQAGNIAKIASIGANPTSISPLLPKVSIADAARLLKGLQEESFRAIGSVSSTLASPATGQEEITLPQKGIPGMVSKIIFGAEEVPSIQKRIATGELDVARFGRETGIKTLEDQALPIAATAVPIFTALEFVNPIGKNKIVKTLADTDNVKGVIKILGELGVPDDLAKKSAPVIAKTKDMKRISNLLTDINRIAKKGVAPKAAKELDPLIQEARKFNTAEEFIKSKGKPLYHGTPVKGVKELRDSERGIFLSSDKRFASLYTRPRDFEGGVSAKVKPTGEVLEVYADLKNPIIETGKTPPAWKQAGLHVDFSTASQSKLKKALEAKGYDGIIERKPTGDEFIVFNSKNVKTRSQLIDIFNQAKGGLEQFDIAFASDDMIKILSKSEDIARKEAKPLSKTVQQHFGVNKLNLENFQQEEIMKRLHALGLDKRTIRTFDDMQEAAFELGFDGPSKLLRSIDERRITDKEVFALRQLLHDNNVFIANAQKRIAKDPTLEELLAPQIRNASQQIDEALKGLVVGGREGGRTVVAFRGLARETMDPDVWMLQAKKMLGNRDLTPEIQKAIRELAEAKDINGLANLVSMLRNPSLAEKGITLWKAGLLTSPTTQFANIGGNVTMAALETVSDIPATVFDVMASLITHKRTTTISLSTVSAKAKGLGAGTKQGAKFMKDGYYPENLLAKYDLRQVNFGDNKVGTILNGYTKAIFRSLGAGDIVFRKAAMAEALEKSAIVTAKNEGLVGAARKARIKELLENPTVAMQMDAIDAAEYTTFQSENILANMISGLKRGAGKNQIALAMIEVLAPFTRTPTNIAARIADYSPVGFMKAVIRAARPSTRSQKNFVDDLGRATTGTGIIAFGAYLAEKGIMTGNAPEGKSERDQFYAEGKQANSIRIGDNWYQLNRISPFGNLLALGAEFHELGQEREGVSLYGATAFAGVKGLTEQTFLKGVSGGLKAVTEPERSFDRFLEQTVSSIIPSVVGRTARTVDPKLRNPENVGEALLARIPGMTGKVAPRVDIFGQEVKVPGGKLNLVDPFSTKEAIDDPVINEAKRIGTTIGMPSQTVDGIKLTNKEYAVFQTVNGQTMREVLEVVIQSDEYKGASPQEQKKMFEKVVREVRDRVRDIVVPSLMIKRFDLPNMKPETVRTLLSKMSNVEKFKKANDKKKKEMLADVISSLQ